MTISQIKNNKTIRALMILLILTISVVFLYQPHFKSRFGGYDNMEWYDEARERNTFGKIIDYRYYSGRLGPSSYFNPGQLLVWNYMVTHYDKNYYPYQALSILIHIINAALVFFLLKIFIKNDFFSFMAALNFAIYYPNFKTIGWIAAAITTGLAAFFIISTLFLAIKYFQTKNKFFYFASLLIFFLGIFTKEIVVFAAPILFVYYFIFQRQKILKFVKTDLICLPYLILSLPIILITIARLNTSALVNAWGGINLGTHTFYRFIDFINFLITAISVSFYIKMAAAGFILLIFPFLIYFGLKDKNLLFLIIFFVLSVAIFTYSNFRDIYSLGRYLYLPSIVWFGLLYYIAENIIKNKKMKMITSFFLLNYTVILNLFLIMKIG